MKCGAGVNIFTVAISVSNSLLLESLNQNMLITRTASLRENVRGIN